MSTVALRWAAVLFAGLAILAGGLQVLAYVATGGPRHLVLGVFALSVGVSVLAAVAGWVRRTRRERHGHSERKSSMAAGTTPPHRSQ
jgi:hypothetical protein